ADEALPAIGPSSLLPETPDARQWREAGPELVAVSPSALLPQAPENRGYPSTPETLPDIGPSSLVPEAERGRSAQPAGPEVVAVSPSELLPPVPPQPKLTRLTVFAAAGVLAVALFFVAAVLIVQRLGPDAQDLLAEA